MKELSKADREYQEKLKKKNRFYLIAIIFMLTCSGILLIGVNNYDLKINAHAIGFLMGMFMTSSVILTIYIFRNRRIMEDLDKLKRYRIIHTDERNIEIISRALYITTYVMLFVFVLLAMIGSFVSRPLMYTASGLIYVFLISYLICYFYFRKKL
ncbi:DUF6442 family protein [Candidatus Enterococcus murrayae]|uniref:DUF2178 domain-containing protein n=1 Tax=Candidatus Enterococcus murrayae TaxID=2815321 RepID=A0ABS3HBR3_9ENTE|nr:DUF6442 family protein [Enterococcus sp. MJM16]MBO0450898.1 hypothetical protein [Enterococcus sp. MJM16]